MQAESPPTRTPKSPPYLWLVITLCICFGGSVARLDAAPQKAEQEEEAVEAAWEYRPYNVVVWLAHDNSWRLQGLEEGIIEGVASQALLADPSSWKLEISQARYFTMVNKK